MTQDFGKVPKWDLADRMRKAMRDADLGVQEMADHLGVSRNTVSTWINGRNRPSAPALKLWAIRTEVSYEWLRDGVNPQVEGGIIAVCCPLAVAA